MPSLCPNFSSFSLSKHSRTTTTPRHNDVTEGFWKEAIGLNIKCHPLVKWYDMNSCYNISPKLAFSVTASANFGHEVHVVEVGRCSSQPLSHSLRYGRSRRSRGRKTSSGRDGLNGTEEQAAWDFIVSRFDLIWVKFKHIYISEIYILPVDIDGTMIHHDTRMTPWPRTKPPYLTLTKNHTIYFDTLDFFGVSSTIIRFFRPGRAMTEPGQARPMLLGEKKKKMHVPKAIYKYMHFICIDIAL